MTAKTIQVIVTTLVVVYRPVSAQFTRCYTQAGCNAVDQVTASSADDCCINKDNGLYFEDGAVCMQCNTFGWLQTTLRGEERYADYQVGLGYWKGSGSAVEVFVELVSGPELRAADFDSSLFSRNARVIRAGHTNSIFISISVDNVAQEGAESGTLRLVFAPGSSQPAGTFFKRDLAVTVNDTTTIEIGFRQIQYLTAEAVLQVSVIIQKKGTQLAHPVSLTVQPMTIDEALTRGLDIPLFDGVNITTEDSQERRRIPVRAKGGVDFSTVATQITFSADEGHELDQRHLVTVPIVDDNIDEADREYFILYLSPSNNPRPGLVLTSVSIGGIEDDDVLQIRFERSAYTFMESPEFETEVEGEVFLVKNIETELTYDVLIRIRRPENQPELNIDYSTNIEEFGSILLVFPNEHRIPVFGSSLLFSILPDGIPEGNEVLRISSSPVNDPGPAYQRPSNGNNANLIIMDDNDNITVGWEETSYTVPEDIGTFEAYYRIIHPPSTAFLSTVQFFVRVTTATGTADENDYQRIGRFDQEQLLNDATRRARVEVAINTDNVNEGTEEFSLNLFYIRPQNRFFVMPNIATVRILDTIASVVCQALPSLDKGHIDYSFDISAPYIVGTSATHICNPGYILNGTLIRTCQLNSSFSGAPPNCESVCDGLHSLANGMISYSTDMTAPYSVGAVATYSCNSGYELSTTGDEMRTCMDNGDGSGGSFGGSAPTCKSVCGALDAIASGMISYSTDMTAPYSVGTVATYTCNSGYELSTTGDEMRICMDNGDGSGGSFEGNAPTCQPQCPVDTYPKMLTTGENACVPCPANSISTVPNSQSCTCLSGYYRTSEEGPSYACTAPPSVCRNLRVFEERTRANTITVRWERPEITGRDDFYYNIFYSEDNQTFTQHNIRPYAKQNLLVDYSLSGLRPLTSYTIRVTAENGVSDQEERGETRSCEVAGRTGDIRPNAPSLVLGLCSVVVWTGPNRAYGRVIGYDVSFVPPGSSNVTVSKGIREMFHIIGENEVPMTIRGSTQVQVRARVPFTDGEWSKLVPVGCTL